MPNINPVAENIFFTWSPTHIATSQILFVRPPILIHMGTSTCYLIETGSVLTLLTGYVIGLSDSCEGHNLNNLCRGPLGGAAYQKIGLAFSDKKISLNKQRILYECSCNIQLNELGKRY